MYPEPQPIKLTREEVEALMGPIDEEAVIAELQEIERTGGHELKDFLPELEKLAAGHD
ncbi:MAG: hypothetical protein U0746_12980 [Gemmataceae bacterium]